MAGIPPSLDSDTEDVAWALQTAEALWKRNERLDAIVWLRRAAQAAGDAQDDDRALALARNAAELAEWMTRQAATPRASARPPAASRSPVRRTSSVRPVDSRRSPPAVAVEVENDGEGEVTDVV